MGHNFILIKWSAQQKSTTTFNHAVVTTSNYCTEKYDILAENKWNITILSAFPDHTDDKCNPSSIMLF